MVAIRHCIDPLIINAYSTIPLNQDVTTTVFRGIYDGNLGRFGNSMMALPIHDRAEFHGLSHYKIRQQLDREGVTDIIALIDERTGDSGAIWYVDTTENSKWTTEQLKEDGQAPVAYPGEDFALFQIRMRISDLPSKAISWDIGCGDLVESITTWPYDPHDTQDVFYSSGLNWTNETQVGGYNGPAYLDAEYDEIELTTDPHLVPQTLPPSHYGIRLKRAVALESGLAQVWEPPSQTGPPPVPGENRLMIAPYNWSSPVWPTGYPPTPPVSHTSTGTAHNNSSSKSVEGRGCPMLVGNTGHCHAFKNHGPIRLPGQGTIVTDS